MVEVPVEHVIATVDRSGDCAVVRTISNEFPASILPGYLPGAYVFGCITGSVARLAAYYSSSVYGSGA